MAVGQGDPGDGFSQRRAAGIRRTYRQRKNHDWNKTVKAMGQVVKTGTDRKTRAKRGLRVLDTLYQEDPEIKELSRFLDEVEAGKLDPNAARGPHGETYDQGAARLFAHYLGALKLMAHTWAYKGMISEREYWAIVRCFDRGKV